MSEGLMLAPDQGRVMTGGALRALLKVGKHDTELASILEVVVPPGFDVGAHLHTATQELFYVLEGELDLLAFEPRTRSADWHEWESASGRRFLKGGAGSMLFVPAGCPHAFANNTRHPARMLFQAAPSGHEEYLDELALLLNSAGGRPDPEAVAELRRRFDIEQLTALRFSAD